MTVLDAPTRVPDPATTPDPWITATVRPAGSFGREDSGRLRALLDALSACASVVVLDLRSARLRSRRAAEAVDEAGTLLEARGGCLLCVHADAESRAHLREAGPHTVLLDGDVEPATDEDTVRDVTGVRRS
jgi:GAF domain-containing protein